MYGWPAEYTKQVKNEQEEILSLKADFKTCFTGGAKEWIIAYRFQRLHTLHKRARVTNRVYV